MRIKNPLVVILATVFIDLLGFSIVIPILAPLLTLQTSQILPNTSSADRFIIFGYLISSYAIAQFFAAPIIGQLSDRFGRKKLLGLSLIGTLLSRLIFIWGILTNNIYLLFAARIFDGITGGNISVAQSSVADISNKENKAKNFGLIGAAFGLGFIIGPYLGSKLGDINTVNWFLQFFPSWIANSSVLPLWFATLLCAINIILLYFTFPETLKVRISKKFSIWAPVHNIYNIFKFQNLRIVFLTIFLITLGFTFFTQYLSVYVSNKFSEEIGESAKNKIQIPESILIIPDEKIKQDAIKDYTDKLLPIYTKIEAQTTSGDLFSYIGLWVVLAQGFLTRILLKRFSPTTQLKLGLIINVIAVLIFLLPDKFIYVFFIIPFFAMSNGMISPNSNALVSNNAGSESQGEILGANQSVQSLAQAIPPIVSGYITSISIGAPILMSAILTFIALIIFVLFYKTNTKEVFHEE